MAGGDDAAKERPFEGHFVVGGSGLYVTTECLGRTFASRTPNFALTIGLPRVGTNLDSVPAEIRERIGEPAVPSKELVPPEWAYGPVDDTERMDEEHISPVWGGVMDDGRARTVYPESARDSAVVYRCRFHTTLTAPSPGQQFDALAEEFLKELDDWWARFTSWVGILTRQDFVGLGGYPGGMTRSYPLVTWSVGASGQRVDRQWRYYAPPNRGPMSKLQLRELEACVTAAGRNPPPPEWLFIRDARSLLQAGQARRAVLDAGTAAEIAMTTLIDKYLDDTQVTDPGVRTAFGRFNNLVAKQEVLKFLRCDLLPERTRPDLIDLRNTAIHGRSRAGSGWEEVTLPQAQTAVEIATAIVEAAHPLASLLAQST